MARPELTSYVAFRRFRCMGHDYAVGDKIQKRHLSVQLARRLVDFGKIVKMDDDDLSDPRKDYLKRVAAE